MPWWTTATGLPGEQLVPGSLGGDRDAQLATPVAHAEPQLRDASGKPGAEHQLADSRAHSAEPATTAIHAPASEAMCTPSAALEAAVREAPEWVVLRYGVVYGPGTWYSRGRLMAQRASRGELAADGDVSSFVHVDDAAGAAVEALAWPSGFVNVCDDAPAAGREWVPAFCRAVGVAEPVAAAGGGRNGWARGADNGYARKQLNWAPAYPSWREGFAALQAPR